MYSAVQRILAKCSTEEISSIECTESDYQSAVQRSLAVCSTEEISSVTHRERPLFEKSFLPTDSVKKFRNLSLTGL